MTHPNQKLIHYQQKRIAKRGETLDSYGFFNLLTSKKL